MERAINLLFGSIGFFILTFLYVFATIGNYKAFSICFVALVIDLYIIYVLNEENIKKWMKKH